MRLDCAALEVATGIGTRTARTERLFRPHRWARWAARVRRLSLDQALADGADPDCSPLLAARALWLLQRRTRDHIALTLERFATGDLLPPTRARVRPSSAAVSLNRTEMLELASVLRSDRHVYVRGLARLDLLLTMGSGPVFVDRRGESLAHELALAKAALFS